jgi:hypothetical protein
LDKTEGNIRQQLRIAGVKFQGAHRAPRTTKEEMLKALEASYEAGNGKRGAAESLGLKYPTFVNRMKSMGISEKRSFK